MIKNLLLLLLLANNLLAEESLERSSLEVGGVTTSSFGNSACDSINTVKVVLPKSATDNFNSFKAYSKSGKDKSTCAKTLTSTSSSIAEFSADDYLLSQKTLLSSGACGNKGEDKKERVLCIYNNEPDGDLVSYALYTTDTRKPDVEIKEKFAGNKEVTIKVLVTNNNGNYKKAEVCYGEKAAGDINDPKDSCPNNFKSETFNIPDINITGLKNQTPYLFKLRVIDDNGSSLDWLESFELTPIPVIYPLGTYNGSGGDIEGSCNQSGSTTLFIALFSFILLAFGKKFKQKHLLLALFFIINFNSNHLSAYPGQFSFGILASPYRPDLDNEKTKDGEKIFPFYKCHFRTKKDNKNGPIRPLLGLEFDFDIWNGFGTLQIGSALKYTWASGYGLEENDDGTIDCSKQLKQNKASLHILQLAPRVSYILDEYADNFPLIPYISAGLIANGYSFFTNNNQAKAENNNNKPMGIRFGWHASLGVLLMLDFLEPSAVNSGRAGGILDHVYLKSELSLMSINTFGTKGLNFSAKDIMGSKLPLLWTFGFVFKMP